MTPQTILGTKEWACKNVNFSKGCSNNCKYCYAKRMGKAFGWKKDWPQMVNKDWMASKTFQKVDGWIMSPSSHDITFTNEDLALKVFQNILEPGNNLLIVSKPHYKIIDRLTDELLPYQKQLLFRFTIGSGDNSRLKFFEPGAPDYQSRVDSLVIARDKGYRTSLSIEPFLSQNVAQLITDLQPLITGDIWVGKMNYQTYLFNQHPETKSFAYLWSRESLLKIFEQLQELFCYSQIRFKDSYRKVLEEEGLL